MERMQQIDPPSARLTLGVKTAALVVVIGVIVAIGEVSIRAASGEGATEPTTISAPTPLDNPGEHYPGRYTLQAQEPAHLVDTF